MNLDDQLTDVEQYLYNHRPIHSFPMSALNLKSKPADGAVIRLRTLSELEELESKQAAHTWMDKKNYHPSLKNNADFIANIEVAFLLCKAVKHKTDDRLPGFQSAEEMMTNCSKDLLLGMLALYNDCQRMDSNRYIESLTKEAEDTIIQTCQELQGSDTPNAALSFLPAEVLAELVVRLSCRLPAVVKPVSVEDAIDRGIPNSEPTL